MLLAALACPAPPARCSHLVLPCLQFWVSQKNKWCEYCKVWMKDTTQSWAVHERGTKHQENVARSECRRPAACPPAVPPSTGYAAAFYTSALLLCSYV